MTPRIGARATSESLMMRPALLVLVASCSSHPGAPKAASAPVVTPDATAAVVAEEESGWTPHRCRKTVWPNYDSSYYRDNEPPDPVEEVSEPELEGGDDGGGGKTLDEKAAEIAKTRPNEGVCDTRHRDNLEAAILAVPAPPPAAGLPKGWDRKSPLAHRELVRSTLSLTASETQQLERDGLVVPARLAYGDYTSAYYDIHRGELPVYVSVDSILHAVYASHDQLLAGIEREKLIAQLDAVLGAMHCGLPVASKLYPTDVANDLDLYLTVARTLLADQEVPSELGKVDAAVAPIVDAIKEAGPLREVHLFGRVRSFDVSQYTPRGHYAGDEHLERYFRAAMWLSRTELNLVSRDTRSSTPGYRLDPSETPREAVVALALADLAETTGALAGIAALDRAWTSFSGRREDIPFADLKLLRAKAGITALTEPEVASRLRAAIGDGYQRTVNVHPSPNVPHLAAIATLLGPRITPDTVALGGLTDERGPALQAAEVGYMLGHDRGLAYIDPKDAALKAKLRTARDHMIHAPLGDDLYSAWLEAIRALAHRPQGAMPSFMDTQSFHDLRLDSAIAAYGQLRHNHVLVAAQVYDQGGCEIPDGYVEPAVATYQALADYARRGRQVFESLDPTDTSKGVAYFARLERLMNVLVALSREELANRPLSASAKRFLSMIVELREAEGATSYNGSIPIATWDGWYIDLFPQMDVSFKDASFMADYATFNRNGQTGVHYIGAKGPRLGVFVVDAGGAPRVMVGPVANAFQHTGPLDRRLDDAAAATIDGDAPWAKSYTAAAPAEPTLALAFLRPPRKQSAPTERVRLRAGPRTQLPPNTLRIDSERELGEVTIELLDHHFVKLASLQVRVREGQLDTVVPRQQRPIEAIRIVAGDFQGRLDLGLDGYGHRQFGKRAIAAPPRANDE